MPIVRAENPSVCCRERSRIITFIPAGAPNRSVMSFCGECWEWFKQATHDLRQAA